MKMISGGGGSGEHCGMCTIYIPGHGYQGTHCYLRPDPFQPPSMWCRCSDDTQTCTPI